MQRQHETCRSTKRKAKNDEFILGDGNVWWLPLVGFWLMIFFCSIWAEGTTHLQPCDAMWKHQCRSRIVTQKPRYLGILLCNHSMTGVKNTIFANIMPIRRPDLGPLVLKHAKIKDAAAACTRQQHEHHSDVPFPSVDRHAPWRCEAQWRCRQIGSTSQIESGNHLHDMICMQKNSPLLAFTNIRRMFDSWADHNSSWWWSPCPGLESVLHRLKGSLCELELFFASSKRFGAL